MPGNAIWRAHDDKYMVASQAMFTPYDHRRDNTGGESNERMQRVLSAVNAAHFGGRCLTGSGGATVG